MICPVHGMMLEPNKQTYVWEHMAHSTTNVFLTEHLFTRNTVEGEQRVTRVPHTCCAQPCLKNSCLCGRAARLRSSLAALCSSYLHGSRCDAAFFEVLSGLVWELARTRLETDSTELTWNMFFVCYHFLLLFSWAWTPSGCKENSRGLPEIAFVLASTGTAQQRFA